MLNKKGNSSTRERISLVHRFTSIFGKSSIAGVLGDREFIGKDWFQYLKNEGISFYFRIKKDADAAKTNGKSIPVHWHFQNLPLHQAKLLEGKRKIYGHELYVTGMRIIDDYLIIVTNKKPEKFMPDEAIKHYGIRWEIETLFGCLKSKGFNFENTHITNRNRIKKLIAVLAVTFCWAHLTGEWKHQHDKKISIKKHGRPAISFFRYGLNWISEGLHKGKQLLHKIIHVFHEIMGKRLDKTQLIAVLE